MVLFFFQVRLRGGILWYRTIKKADDRLGDARCAIAPSWSAPQSPCSDNMGPHVRQDGDGGGSPDSLFLCYPLLLRRTVAVPPRLATSQRVEAHRVLRLLCWPTDEMDTVCAAQSHKGYTHTLLDTRGQERKTSSEVPTLTLSMASTAHTSYCFLDDSRRCCRVFCNRPDQSRTRREYNNTTTFNINDDDDDDDDNNDNDDTTTLDGKCATGHAFRVLSRRTRRHLFQYATSMRSDNLCDAYV